MNELAAVRALGWASLAIAATEIFAQGFVEKEMLGIDEHAVLLRGLGVREAVAGITILSQKSITPTICGGVWSRVAGDVMDLALLALAFPKTKRSGAFTLTNLLVLPIIIADVYYAVRLTRRFMTSNPDRLPISENVAPRRKLAALS